eukprot:4214379-Lingulodinium_polyedra.AAC.1
MSVVFETPPQAGLEAHHAPAQVPCAPLWIRLKGGGGCMAAGAVCPRFPGGAQPLAAASRHRCLDRPFGPGGGQKEEFHRGLQGAAGRG